MPANCVYQVKVGKNVASLKGYHNPKKRRLHLEHLQEGELSSQTTATSIEVPLGIVVAGLALGALGYLCFTWNEMSVWLSMPLGFLFSIPAAYVIIYGIGLISARHGFIYKDQQGQYWRRFFWITLRQEAGQADYVYCTGTIDPETRTSYLLDVSLHYPQPVGPIAVAHLRGYTKIPADKGAQYTPYENALFEIHEKAKDVAEKLELPFKPNFSAGPVIGQFAEFFKDLEADGTNAGKDEAKDEQAGEELKAGENDESKDEQKREVNAEGEEDGESKDEQESEVKAAQEAEEADKKEDLEAVQISKEEEGKTES